MSQVILVTFYAGQALNILKHANLSARSQLSGIRSVRHYFETNALAIAIRVFAATMILLIWETNPSALQLEGIPLTAGTAGLGGLFADFALDFFMAKFGMQKELPPLNGSDKEKAATPTQQQQP